MEQMNLEGDNLGQKHRNYNILVKNTAADDAYKLSELNYGESDVHNMLRIDVACIRRDVEYLLEVFESEDMLYVSRAIKGSVWLVTEEQYSHIVNPEYLNKILLPNMMTKAKNMLLASIRNNLKDPTRAEAFFNYYKDNFGVAQGWLRHCSIDFIEDIVVKHADEIYSNTIKHLCRKSSKILKCYLNSHSRDCHLLHRYLLQAEREEAIQILDLIYSANQRKPCFGKRFTRSLMKRYADDIVDNFQRYYYGIHMPTFVKYLDKEKIENILLRDIDNDFMKHFYIYDNLKHFLRYMPEKNRLKLIKTILSDTEKETSHKSAPGLADLRVTLGNRCYEFVPFECAFLELKQAIITESSPYKRKSIFNVLIHSAKGNSQHIQILLEFYRTHFNAESVENKIQFLNKLITPNLIHRINPQLWSILEDIFISMDLYVDIPKCFEAFIIHKLIQEEHISENFKNKVNSKSFLDFRPYLSVDEQKTVLNYVYDACFAQTLKKDIGNEKEMYVMVDTIKHILGFLRDWNKRPDEYPFVTHKIREIIKIKINNNWSTDLSALYRAHKLFRKQLYDVSLVFCLSDETCLNVLKHDASLLLNQRDVIVDRCSNQPVLLKRTLGKIRVYWPESVQQWIKSYLKMLHQSVNQRIIVKSIFTLLNDKEAMSILITKYAPGDTNSDNEKSNIGLRQNIIRCLHLLRPLVSNKALFLYAKSEYLPCLLPSLDVLLRYQSSNEFWKSIFSFLNYEPLRKYGARIAISKLKNNHKFNDYQTIKVPLIKKLLDLLNKEENVDFASDMWDLLIIVYGDLLPDEKKKVQISMYTIYTIKEPIKPISFVKLYEIYKLFGPKCENTDEFVINTANDLIKNLDTHFIENEMIKIATHLIFIGNNIDQSTSFLIKYILNCDSEKGQIAKYEKYLAPILADCIASTGMHRCETAWCYPSCAKHKIYKIVDSLTDCLFTSITEFKCIVPVQLYTLMKNKLESELNNEEWLYIFIIMNHIVMFIEKLRDHVEYVGKVFDDEDRTNEWNKFCLDFLNSVAQAWILYYKSLLSVSGTFHVLVSKACLNIFESLRLNNDFKLSFVKLLLSDNDDPLLYCIAIDILRHLYIYDENGQTQENPLHDLVNIQKERKGELNKIISSHPSIEVQLYYNHYANKL